MKHLKDFNSMNESAFDTDKKLGELRKLKGNINKIEKFLDSLSFDEKWEMCKKIGRTKGLGLSKQQVKQSRPGYLDMWLADFTDEA